MPLSQHQQKLLSKYNTNPQTGLTQSQIQSSYVSYNNIPSPINCPSWVCCLLPCLKHLPSMKLYQKILPHDAEVYRDSTWVYYDASSILTGDLIRINEGDRVPADCIVLSLGMEWDWDASTNHIVSSLEELLVDVSDITGEERPRVAKIGTNDGSTTPTKLLYGSLVVQGSCVALVTGVGEDTVLAKWIRKKEWPPKASTLPYKRTRSDGEYVSVSMNVNAEDDDYIENEERGVSMSNR